MLIKNQLSIFFVFKYSKYIEHVIKIMTIKTKILASLIGYLNKKIKINIIHKIIIAMCDTIKNFVHLFMFLKNFISHSAF